MDGAPVHRFLGIPYAQPPSGELRFRPPVALPQRTGEVDATGYGPAAPQNPDARDPDETPLAWSEDGCLNLNIWTPETGGTARPVMVWIHGGAYLMGSNSDGMYDGARLAAATGTVVVAINYRLGALGFLHLAHLLGEGFVDSSNLGLLDQIEALRWVRDNIAGFGGDPHNVTCWRIGRRGSHRHPAGHAGVGRPLPAGHHAKRHSGALPHPGGVRARNC